MILRLSDDNAKVTMDLRHAQKSSWAGSSGKSGPKDQVALHYYYTALVHDSRGIEIVNFTISLALSAGTLMASAGMAAGTQYRLVPAHFYPWLHPRYPLLPSAAFWAGLVRISCSLLKIFTSHNGNI